MLSSHFNTIFRTERLSAVVGGKQSYTPVIDEGMGMLQPVGDEFNDESNTIVNFYAERINIRKNDVMYITSIYASDQELLSQTEEVFLTEIEQALIANRMGELRYKVSQVLDYNFGGTKHLKLLLSK